MRKLDRIIEDYLFKKGYFHEEEQKTTYKCSSQELKRYKDFGGAFPEEDPEGDAEFTKTVTRDVIDEYTIEELELIIRMETANHLRTIKIVAVSFILFVFLPLIVYLIGLINDMYF